jgi:hypothetical protein
LAYFDELVLNPDPIVFDIKLKGEDIKDYNNALRLQGNLQFVLPQDIEAALNKLEQ